jgi:PhnB protein
MAQLNPYLNFNGNCKEAMTFYQACMGGELTMQKVSESPMAAQLPSQAGASILHSTLTNGSLVLMGSDMIGAKLTRGNDISISVICQDEEEINSLFANLSEGGNVRTPLHQSFWGATYGELTDKFGLNWMFNYSKQ